MVSDPGYGTANPLLVTRDRLILHNPAITKSASPPRPLLFFWGSAWYVNFPDDLTKCITVSSQPLLVLNASRRYTNHFQNVP